MDLAVTFKAHAQDNLNETNRQPKIVPFNTQAREAAPASSSNPLPRPDLPCCQECLHPTGKPISLQIQHHAPALHFSHTTKEYALTYGPLMTTQQDVIRIKPDLSSTAVLDLLYRHSGRVLPWVANDAARWSEASFSVFGEGERWEFLDARRCEEILPLVWDKEAEVRLRVRAVDYTAEWEERETRRLKAEEEDRREREREMRMEVRRGCVVM